MRGAGPGQGEVRVEAERVALADHPGGGFGGRLGEPPQRPGLAVHPGPQHLVAEPSGARDPQPVRTVPGGDVRQGALQLRQPLDGDLAEERQGQVPAVDARPAQPVRARELTCRGDGVDQFLHRFNGRQHRDKEPHGPIFHRAPCWVRTFS